MSQWKYMSRRNVLAAGGMAAAGLGLAACGGGDSGGGGGGGSALNQWYHQYGEAGTEDAAKKYAADYPDGDVNVNWVMGDYAAKLSTSLLSGEGVDIFENNAIAVDQAEQGRYADLTSIMEQVADQFSEAALIQPLIDGKYWGVPMILDPQFFYYRKSLLDAAGIAPPETWDDLVAAAKELTSPEISGLFLGNNLDATTWPMIWAAGGTPLTEDFSATAFNTEGLASGMAGIQQMQADKSLLTGAPADWADPSAFATGLCAMAWGGCWALPQLEEVHGDDVGVFPLPAIGGEGRQVSLVNPWTEQIAGASKNVEGAMEFVKWLWIENTEAQTDWSLNYGFHIPPLKAAAEAAEPLKAGNGLEIVKMSNEMGVSGPPQWTGDIGTPYADAVSNILKNGADPAEALAGAEEAGNKVLSR